jgi:outer membrane protein assembly factor BamB
MIRAGRAGRAGRAALAALAASSLLGGCAVLDWFGPDRPEPKPLPALVEPIAPRAAWTGAIGAVRFPLVVARTGGTLTFAASDGTVAALEAATGRTLWRTNVGARITAGVGSDGTRTAVVTDQGELVALENGQPLWRAPLGTRVSTAPLVAGGRVFVLGVDRAVQAFDGQDGSRLWRVARPGDPLTLAQSGVLSAVRDTLVVGQGPRLAGIDPAGTSLRWEAVIGSPRGANEIERLADLVGPPVRVGDTVCARSFQAAVGCVDAAQGRVAWTKAVGGLAAIAGDAEILVGGDASDRIAAWKTPSGDTAWTQDDLMHRGLGAPAVFGGSVVVGDRDGVLHWLSRAAGRPQARTPTDGSPPAAQPVAVDGTLVVTTRNGGVFAFRGP